MISTVRYCEFRVAAELNWATVLHPDDLKIDGVVPDVGQILAVDPLFSQGPLAIVYWSWGFDPLQDCVFILLGQLIQDKGTGKRETMNPGQSLVRSLAGDFDFDKDIIAHRGNLLGVLYRFYKSVFDMDHPAFAVIIPAGDYLSAIAD